MCNGDCGKYFFSENFFISVIFLNLSRYLNRIPYTFKNKFFTTQILNIKYFYHNKLLFRFHKGFKLLNKQPV